MRTPRDALSPGYTHLILAAVVIATAGSSIALLYRASFRQQEDRLTETVTSRARLMEAVAQFDAVYSATDVPSGATAATLGQVRQAHERFQGFGATGEFTLARREGDEIVFVMRQRHSGLAERTSVPLDSALAEPMRRALRGESGTLVGADYRGARVLAAHEPVDTLGLGVVAKIDLAEIREPFLRAGALSMGLGLALVALAAGLLLRPLVTALEESEARYREATEVNGRFYDVMEQTTAGATVEDLLDHVYDAFKGVIPYDGIGFALLEPGGDVLRSHWARCEYEDVEIGSGFAKPLEGSSLERIISTGEPGYSTT